MMINEPNPTPDLTKMTRAERLAFFSAATPTVNRPTAPVKRLPPRSRRNSVPHRAIR